MKPSEIAARLAEIESEAKPLREQLTPLDEQAEALRRQKAAIVNAVGAKLRRLRDESKMSLADYAAFRQRVLAATQDDREELVDAEIEKQGLG